MSFVEQVNSIKEGVLGRQEYNTPIKEIMFKANAYSVTQNLEETLRNPNEEEITR